MQPRFRCMHLSTNARQGTPSKPFSCLASGLVWRHNRNHRIIVSIVFSPFPPGTSTFVLQGNCTEAPGKYSPQLRTPLRELEPLQCCLVANRAALLVWQASNVFLENLYFRCALFDCWDANSSCWFVDPHP